MFNINMISENSKFPFINNLPKGIEIQADEMQPQRMRLWRMIGDSRMKEWECISENLHNSTVYSDGEISWKRVFLRRYKEVRRTLWRWINSDYDQSVLGPGNRNVMPLERPREALYLWMQNVDINISNKVIRTWPEKAHDFVEIGEFAGLLPDTSLVTLAQQENLHMQNTLLESIKPYGTIVFDRNPDDDCEQICVFFKHVHGDVQLTTGKALKSPKYGQLFFEHQNSIVQAMSCITEKSPEKMQLYIEGLQAGHEAEFFDRLRADANRPSADIIESSTNQFSTSPERARAFFQQVQNNMERGYNMDRNFQGYCADIRFLTSEIEKGSISPDRVHGMFTQQRSLLQLQANTSIRSLDNLIASKKVDHDYTHRYLINQIEQNSGRDAIHLVVLGAAHFCHSAAELHPLNIQMSDYAIEKYAVASRNLSRTRIIVVEPSGFLELDKFEN